MLGKEDWLLFFGLGGRAIFLLCVPCSIPCGNEALVAFLALMVSVYWSLGERE